MHCTPATAAAVSLGVAGAFALGYLFGRSRRAGPASEADDTVGEAPVPRRGEELKMVLVARVDLKMGTGKTAAQCCHATLGAAQRAMKAPPLPSCPQYAWWHLTGWAACPGGGPGAFALGYLFGRSRRAGPASEADDTVGEAPVPRRGEELKMVLVARVDLKMGTGKTAAQCCHATLGAAQRAMKNAPELLRAWSMQGQAKIVVKAQSEDELLELQEAARKKRLVSYLVADAGRTQIAAGSLTVLAVGPGPKSLVDEVTGHLKLM
eukprot:m51a1_g3322 putative peptidyl-trna hydrolase (265) ;mRNA; r:356614-357586